MSTEEICAWVRRFRPYYDEEECLEAYRIYRAYYAEGHRWYECLMYAGLL